MDREEKNLSCRQISRCIPAAIAIDLDLNMPDAGPDDGIPDHDYRGPGRQAALNVAVLVDAGDFRIGRLENRLTHGSANRQGNRLWQGGTRDPNQFREHVPVERISILRIQASHGIHLNCQECQGCLSLSLHRKP